MDTNENRSWWNRHWKWLVPVLGVFAAVLFIGLFIGIFALILGTMKSSGAYQQAVARASREPALIAAIGQPITPGYFTTGKISISNEDGWANLVIALHGPKGEASIHLCASRHAGIWTYSLLTVDIDATRQHVDLLQPQANALAQ